MTRQYQVHEFAALAGVTAKTLRHYDRLGLLQPLRTAAGYRAYDEKDLCRLEQIVALKFIGLPLKDIRRLLDRHIPLSEALSGQLTVLKEKQQLLDRAISAIQDVERTIASGKRPDSAILRRLIEVIAMQNHVQTMKQYYTGDAWETLTWLRWQYRDEQRGKLSDSWANAFREAKSLVGEDPAGDTAQDFCSRWGQLWQSTTGGDADVLSGIRKAWSNRGNWPPEMQQLAAEFDVNTVGDFISKALSASMKKYYSAEAWARKAALERPGTARAWNALCREVQAALNDDPSSKKGQDLARRWCQLCGASTQGDPEIVAGLKRAWEDHENWPFPLRQHIAKLNMPQIVKWIGKAIREFQEGVS